MTRPPAAVAPRSSVFATLDGLRCIAALAVVCFHFTSVLKPYNPPGAFLAVDLFFCLSGFVIAHAYGDRLAKGLPFRDFVAIRLIRLYPLFLLSVIINGAIFALSALVGSADGWTVTAMIGTALLFLPNPWDSRLFPINEPAWSLFFELLVNFLAAAFWRQLSNGVLTGLMITGAVGLVILGTDNGTIDAGYRWSGFALSSFRVCFSFFTGILLYRLHNRIILPRVHPVVLFAALSVVLLYAPKLGVAGELLSVFIVFPVLVLLGSQNEPSRPASLILGGKVSYALYVLHATFLNVVLNFCAQVGFVLTPPLSGVALVIVLIAFCLLADRFFDVPVRRWLMARFVPAKGKRT
jgi:peptidoglycan/LPS O-acetylase OafA/YrhL